MVAGAVLGGCSFLRPHDDPTRFYVLTVPPALTARFPDGEFKKLRIGLKPVELPAYLRSRALVVRMGTNEIHFADYDRWAEPLDQGISRLVKETLSSAPNVETVTLTSHGDDTLDYEVAIRVLACEGVRVEKGAGTIRFAVTSVHRLAGGSGDCMKDPSWASSSLSTPRRPERHGYSTGAV